MPKKPRTNLINVTLDGELLSALAGVAVEAGSNRSEILRRCCALFLSNGALHHDDDRTEAMQSLLGRRCMAPLANRIRGGWPCKRKPLGSDGAGADTIREIQRLMDGSRDVEADSPLFNEREIAALLGITPEPERKFPHGTK